MINGVNKVPLYPIFFENQVPVRPNAPFEDKKEKETPPNKLEGSDSKEAEKVPQDLLKSDKSDQEELEKAKEATPQEVVEEKKKKEEEEKKVPIPSLMEIIKDKIEAEKESKPMAYSVKALRKAIEIPQQSVDILLRKLGLYNIDFLA